MGSGAPRESEGRLRYARQVDDNHGQVLRCLRGFGFVVIDTSRAGMGFPDLVAARAGRLALVEVKNPDLPPSARRLSPAEADVHTQLARAGVPVHVVETLADVERLASQLTKGQP